MSVTVTLDGTDYELPTGSESDWGDEVTNYLVALAETINDLDAAATPSNATPAAVGTAAAGVAATFSRGDHVHAHGNQLGGTLHAPATNAVAGFASAAHIATIESLVDDVSVLDIALAALDTQLQALDTANSVDFTLGAVGASPNANGATRTGQVLNLELASSSFPGLFTAAQFTKLAGIATGATVGVTTMAAVGATPNANGASVSGVTLTLQPASGSQPGALTAGAQTIGGDKVFSGRPNFSGGVSTTYCFKVDKDHLTTFGGPSALIGGDNHSGTGQVYTLGYGYATATSKPAVEVGAKDTDTAGFHKSAFVVATRDVTTDTAPTERFRINPDGKAGFGRTATTNLLEVEGAIESKVTGFIFPDGTTQSSAAVGSNPIEILDEGVSETAAATSIDFVGAGVSVSAVGDDVTVTISGGGSGAVEVLDEGGSLSATATSIDFVGAGVTATAVGDDITVTIPGGSGSGGWSLATPPASPHADDCEFDEASIAAGGWTEGGTSVGTAINRYAAFATAANWRHSYNGLRPGWLMIQPATDAAPLWPISKTITVPTDLLVWARLSFTSRVTTTPTANDHCIALALTASSGGAVDGLNHVAIFLQETDANEYAIQFQKQVAGVLTTTEYVVTMVAEKHGFSYVAIQKISNDYYFWVAPENGNWLYLGTLNYAGTAVDRVAIQVTNANGAAPGNMVMGVDFIRFSATADFLP